MTSPASLRLVVLGLSLSSSWGNGHATTFRALLRAFAARGHAVLFLERDVPWYAEHRDLVAPDFCDLRFYQKLDGLTAHATAIAQADAVLVGSYVPDGIAVGRYVQTHAQGATAFYDIDTPVTVAQVARSACAYLNPAVAARYDRYFSFTGGPMLDRLRAELGARPVPLYCSVDEAAYRPLEMPFRWDLSYIGTYSADRQPTLDRLLLEPARRAPHRRFVVAGPQYPDTIDWPANVARIDHLGPAEHPAFYASSRYTLNVTRAEMVRAGYSPSVRLFEAAACGTPLISDVWHGIETLFDPAAELVLARTPEDVLDVIEYGSDARRAAQAAAARARVLAGHTAAHRAAQLERHLREAIAERHAAQTTSRANRRVAGAPAIREPIAS